MQWDTKVEHLTQTSGNQGRPSGGSDIYIMPGKLIGSPSGKGELGRGS